MKGKIIWGTIALVLAGLWFGVPDFQKYCKYAFYSALNWDSRRQQEASAPQATGNEEELANTCRGRMSAIEGAKQALMNQSGTVQAGGTPTHQAVADRLGQDLTYLQCPKSGSRYLLGHMAQRVNCTVGGNGTPTFSADDHSI